MTEEKPEWLRFKEHLYKLNETRNTILHDAHVDTFYSDANNFVENPNYG